jgi:hypothetical protein
MIAEACAGTMAVNASAWKSAADRCASNARSRPSRSSAAAAAACSRSASAGLRRVRQRQVAGHSTRTGPGRRRAARPRG